MSSEISLSKGFTLCSEFGIKAEKRSPKKKHNSPNVCKNDMYLTCILIGLSKTRNKQ